MMPDTFAPLDDNRTTPPPLRPEASQFNVTASYRDRDSADRAVDALRSAGIDVACLSVEETKPAGAQPVAVPSPRSPLVWRAVWSGFVWGVPGAAAGALIGLGIGALGGNAPLLGANIAIEVASWAMFLHIAAALCGVYITLNDAEAWGIEDGAHGDGFAVAVHVGSNQRGATDRAERVLWDAGATGVVEHHASGTNRTWMRSHAGR